MKEKFAFQIFIQLFTKIISLLSTYILISKITKETYGAIGFVADTINMAFVLGSIGLESILNKHSKDDNFYKFFINYFYLNTFLVLLNFLPIFFLVFLVDDINIGYFVIIAFSILIQKFTSGFVWLIKAKLKMFKINIALFTSNILNSLFTILLAYNADHLSDILYFLGGVTLFCALLNLILIVIFSFNEFHFQKIEWKFIKQLLKETKPLILVSILSQFITHFGGFILGFAFGLEDYAYFRFVNSIVISFLLLISGSISQNYQTLFARWFKDKNYKQIQLFTHQLEKYSSIFFGAILIGVFLNIELAFALILPEFAPSAIYVYILIFIPYIAGITRPYIKQMVPGDRQKEHSQVAAVKLVLKFILTIVLIPKSIFEVELFGFGAIGNCIILLLPWIIDLWLYRYFSWKYFGIKSNYHILYHQVVMIVSLVISYYLKRLFIVSLNLSNLMVFIISSSFLIVIYLLGLILVKELKTEDVAFLKGLIQVNNYKTSLKEEFSN